MQEVNKGSYGRVPQLAHTKTPPSGEGGVDFALKNPQNWLAAM